MTTQTTAQTKLLVMLIRVNTEQMYCLLFLKKAGLFYGT